MGRLRSSRTSRTVRMRHGALSSEPRVLAAWRRVEAVETNRTGSIGTHARRKTRSERRILSSKVARKVPSGIALLTSGILRTAFFTEPRMPETVRSPALRNLETSSSELNMPLMNAVFFWMWKGSPTSLSFLTMGKCALSSVTTPVALTRNDALVRERDWHITTPVPCGVMGPKNEALQCRCSGVYFRRRLRPPLSSIEYTGRDWNRRQPMLNTTGSFDLSTPLFHLCLLTFARIKEVPSSAMGLIPPAITGYRGSKNLINSIGTL
mmetsp:Transcript_11692/g.29571  ORF Transcript_11692/g.29571 Transcript_11692/m.29571 type:complete len:266 (-) Transcript_11692:679-1476(-)